MLADESARRSAAGVRSVREPARRSGVHPTPTDAADASRESGRKEQTQERIVAAAVALFATRGYEGTSIAAIASRARVSRSAVFWHFGDKEGLFRESFRRMLVPFYRELQATLEPMPPRERVFEMLSTYERVVDENEAAIRSIVRWLLESEKLRASLLGTLFSLHDSLVGDLREALLAAGTNPERGPALAAALVALLDGNLLLEILDPNAGNRDLRRAGLRHLVELALGNGDV